MKLRLILQRKKKLLLCPNGSIMEVDNDVLQRLLHQFKRPNTFKGTAGYWNLTVADMGDVAGTTLAYVDDMSRLVLISDKLYEEPEDVSYVSATEYADAQGKSRAMVKRLCADGRIEGVYKTSSGWLIPANAPWPERKPRISKNEMIEQLDRKSGPNRR